MNQAEWRRARAQAKETLQHHHYRDAPSRSWRFGAMNSDGTMSGTYGYTVTWTPGVLALAGDIGDLTITHYYAMPTIAEAAKWMHRAEFSYIMGKSSQREVFHAGDTAAALISKANEEALIALRHILDERRRFRADCAEADPDDQPCPEHYDLNLQFGRPLSAFDTRESRRWWPRRGRHQVPPPDGFEPWFQLANAAESSLGYQFDAGAETAKGRRDIRQALREDVSDETLQNICQDLGWDYCSSYDYPPCCMIQFIALQRWAQHIIDEASRESARGRLANVPDLVG